VPALRCISWIYIPVVAYADILSFEGLLRKPIALVRNDDENPFLAQMGSLSAPMSMLVKAWVADAVPLTYACS
jgi:hypothetical protein